MHRRVEQHDHRLRPLRDTQQVPSLVVLTDLSVLKLFNNSILAIPPSFSQLTNLRFLDISKNHLTSLEGLSSNFALTYLDVSQNFLSSVVPLRNLTALKHLSFSTNFVPALPNFNFSELLSVCFCAQKSVSFRCGVIWEACI